MHYYCSLTDDEVVEMIVSRVGSSLETLELRISKTMQRWTTLAVCINLREIQLMGIVQISSDMMRIICSLPMISFVCLVGTHYELEWSSEISQAIIAARLENGVCNRRWLDLHIYRIRDFANVYHQTTRILAAVAVRWWNNLIYLH